MALEIILNVVLVILFIVMGGIYLSGRGIKLLAGKNEEEWDEFELAFRAKRVGFLFLVIALMQVGVFCGTYFDIGWLQIAATVCVVILLLLVVSYSGNGSRGKKKK